MKASKGAIFDESEQMCPDLRLRFWNLEPGWRDRKLPNGGSIEILTVVGGQQPNGGVGVSLAHWTQN